MTFAVDEAVGARVGGISLVDVSVGRAVNVIVGSAVGSLLGI